MSFPNIKPTSRNCSLGDYPVRYYEAISGAEVRLVYGSKRRQATLDLSYEALSAAEANQFVCHYESVKGTTYTFGVGTALTVGWISGGGVQGQGAWRYDGPPSFTQAGGECDKVNVSVKLVTVVS